MRRVAMNAQLYIHIGLPKTATTFLQWKVFPRIENVAFLGKAKALDFYALYGRPEDKFLISYEHLLANPFRPYPGGWLNEFRSRLVLLARRFPDARIMISFRAQEALLTSYYKEYLSKPGRPYLTLEEFFDVDRNLGLVKKEDLLFMPIIDLVEASFRKKPFVFLFEDVVGRLPDFLSDLSTFLGERVPAPETIDWEKVNPGLKYHQARLLVKLHAVDSLLKRIPFLPDLYNPLFRRLSIYPDRLCRKHLAFMSDRPLLLTEAQRRFIGEFYREDWDDLLAYVERARSERFPDSNGELRLASINKRTGQAS